MAKLRLLDRLPVVHQLRQSVGLQRGMLVAGLVLTGFFLLVAIFAPWLAPYGFAQLRGPDGLFGAQQPPSPEHLLGTTVGGYDVLSRTIWGAQTALPRRSSSRCILSVFIGILLGLVSGYLGGWAGQDARRRRRRDLRLPDAAARDRGRHRHQRRAVGSLAGHHGGRDLDHGRLHPAVLPRRAVRGGAGQVRGVRRVGQGHRRVDAAHHVRARAAQRHADTAADRHPERVGGDRARSRPSASSASASSRRRRRSGATTSRNRSATCPRASGGRRSRPASPSSSRSWG